MYHLQTEYILIEIISLDRCIISQDFTGIHTVNVLPLPASELT